MQSFNIMSNQENYRVAEEFNKTYKEFDMDLLDTPNGD